MARNEGLGRVRPLFFLITVALLDCATLDHVGAGACGNGVVDANEDCDSFPAACGTVAEGAAACRLKCGAGQPACPDGWGCAVDGVCRQPTGHFGSASDPVSTGVASMVVGDFDGDHRADILGSGPRGADNAARARVHYFGAHGVLDLVNPLPAPLASPTVHDFDGDGLDDLAFGAGSIGAFGVFLGQSDRTLVPMIYPSFHVDGADVKPVLVRSTSSRFVPGPQGATGGYLYAGRRVIDGKTVDALTSLDLDTENHKAYFHTLPVGPEDLVGVPVWARIFDKVAASTCGEVAIGMNVGGAGQIQVFSPCAAALVDASAASWASLGDPVVIDAGDALTGFGIHVADMDADGHADVLFATSKGVQVARGDGVGFGKPAPTTIVPDVPIASGDIDGDGGLDFVVPGGIVLSVPIAGGGGPLLDAGAPGGYLHRFFPSQRRSRWTTARIANLNGDPYPDVVAASADQPDIDFFDGAPPGSSLTPSTIATTGPVSFLVNGDFDGDHLDDLAFAEGRSGASQTDIAVAYARPLGPPDAPRTVGRISDLVDLETDVNAGAKNLTLFLKSAPPAGQTVNGIAVAIVLASGDRQPLAPLILPDQNATVSKPVRAGLTRTWAPASVHAGSIDRTDRVDLLGLAIGYTTDSFGLPSPPYPTAAWVARGNGPAGFDEAQEMVELPSDFETLDAKGTFELPTQTADIDSPPDGLIDMVIIGHAKANAQAALVVIHPKNATPSTPPTPTIVPLGAGLLSSSSSVLRLVDVDGDGLRDAVAVLGTAPAQPTDPSSKVVVFFNDGKGGFVGGAGVAVSLPPPDPSLKKTDAGPTSVAVVVTGGATAAGDGKRTRQLGILTQHRLFLAALKADKSGFDVTDLTPNVPNGVGLGAGIAAGDFDGDGVEDLAIADTGSIRLLLQIPRLP